MKKCKHLSMVRIGATLICLALAGSAAGAEFLFRVSTSSNAESVHYAGMTVFKDLVEKRSNGKIEVKTLPFGGNRR